MASGTGAGYSASTRQDQSTATAATLPSAAQPVYVLRGHRSAIHSLTFLRHNSRLLSGDADGWAVLWTLASKRPAAVWKAHEGAVLGLVRWGDERVISQGRDGKVIVWQLKSDHEAGLDKRLPVDDADADQKNPWILHSIKVETVNFCALAVCSELEVRPNQSEDGGLLMAVPAAKDNQIDVFQLPTEHHLSTVPAVQGTKTGMVMAIRIFHHQNSLLLAAGYENGCLAVFQQNSGNAVWLQRSTTRFHTQPLLSIDVAPNIGMVFSSAADAIIASYPIVQSDTQSAREFKTKHSGQQGLAVRPDDKILATAGWDARVRVYSTKTLKELAVLKWHKEGCYAVAFAPIQQPVENISEDTEKSYTDSHRDIEQRADSSVFQTVEQRRHAKVSATHWLAAGSKDGKISLWDIY
ncbi:MAG: hypothetical protein M1820_009962 [Bogoriella megaspora]|nr:MAG: hypothetical protein M1820_009962 [Bogoriella megaspora]